MRDPFGRSADISLILDVLGQVHEHGAAAVVVEGEAGIGKSRVLAAVCAAARERFAVHAVDCGELEGGQPFGALADAFTTYDTTPAGARIAELLRPAAVAESTFVPELQYRLVAAFVELVEQLTLESSVLLAVEDLHWADPSTLLTLRALATRLADSPFALVATCRPTPRPPQLDALIDTLVGSGGRVLPLGPLDDDGVEQLVREELGAEPGRSLLRQVAGAGGNPLFVLELVRALREEGSIEVTGGRAEVHRSSLPPTLRLTILRRLSALGEDSLHALRVASVLGSAFDVHDLAAVTGRSAADLLADLLEPLRAGLLREAGDRLAFRHDLIREAIYQDLPLAIRSGLHRDAARAVAARDGPAAVVAMHVSIGATAGDTEAVEYLRAAARDAAPRSPGVAAELLQRACELASPGALRDAVLAELVPALVWSSRHADGERAARDLLARDDRRVVDVDVLLALGQSLFLQGRISESLQHLERAAAAVPSPSLLAQIALGRMTSGDLDGAVAAADDVLRDGTDAWACTIALYASAYVRYLRGHVHDAQELAARAAASGTEGVDEVRWREPRFIGGVVLMGVDRFADAEAVFRDGLLTAENRGSVWDIPLYHLGLSLHRFWSGSWDDAVAEAEAGLALAGEVQTLIGAIWPHAILAHIALHRDDLPRAEEELERARDAFRALGPQQGVDLMTWGQALVHEIRGDPERGLRVLASGWDVVRALGMDGQLYRAAPDLVRMAVATGDVERARDATGAVETAARRMRTPYAQGAALRCRGIVDADPDAHVAAVRAYRASPRPVELAFACEDAGTALAGSGRTEEAIVMLDEAVQLYEAPGAVRDAARTEAVLRSLGVRRGRRGPRARPVAGWDSLTATETDVVRLASEGLTNADIGRRLFISARTVQTHLSHVFAKLGVSSRVELAAQATRRST